MLLKESIIITQNQVGFFIKPKYKKGDVLKLWNGNIVDIVTIKSRRYGNYYYIEGQFDPFDVVDNPGRIWSYDKVIKINHRTTKLGKILYK